VTRREREGSEPVYRPLRRVTGRADPRRTRFLGGGVGLCGGAASMIGLRLVFGVLIWGVWAVD
jgi:hypothetical protein